MADKLAPNRKRQQYLHLKEALIRLERKSAEWRGDMDAFSRCDPRRYETLKQEWEEVVGLMLEIVS
jgi:hypothetical protein